MHPSGEDARNCFREGDWAILIVIEGHLVALEGEVGVRVAAELVDGAGDGRNLDWQVAVGEAAAWRVR